MTLEERVSFHPPLERYYGSYECWLHTNHIICIWELGLHSDLMQSRILLRQSVGLQKASFEAKLKKKSSNTLLLLITVK